MRRRRSAGGSAKGAGGAEAPRGVNPALRRGLMYNERDVEHQEWAKAHFFVGRRKEYRESMSLGKQAIVEKIAAIANRVCGSEGIEIVDVELLGSGGSRLLRISIDRPGGVSHEHCELISRQVGTILDVEDVIPGGSYHLEVSSPGLERKLSKPGDFERFIGREAKVLLRQPVENQRRWEGRLARFEAGVVTLEPEPGREVRFDLSMVEKANLKFKW